jgi:hypothetical protein
MLSLAVAGSVIMAAETAVQLTLNKCGLCHSVDKSCKHLGKKDTTAWTTVVEGMIKKGAKIDDQEKKIISTYLAGLKTGAKPICK